MGVDGRASQFEHVSSALLAMFPDLPDGVLTGDADDLWGPERAHVALGGLDRGIFSQGRPQVALFTNHDALVTGDMHGSMLDKADIMAKLSLKSVGIDMLRRGAARIKGADEMVEHYEWLYGYKWLCEQIFQFDTGDTYTDLRLVQAAIYEYTPESGTSGERLQFYSQSWSYFWRPPADGSVPAHVCRRVLAWE
eukprot:2953733-Prymnesium_polylepis.2